MNPEIAEQVPAVFCGPMADAAFFAALALAVYGMYGMVKIVIHRTMHRSDQGETSEYF